MPIAVCVCVYTCMCMCVVQLFVYVSVCMYVSRGGEEKGKRRRGNHSPHTYESKCASFYHMTSSHSLTLDIA